MRRGMALTAAAMTIAVSVRAQTSAVDDLIGAAARASADVGAVLRSTYDAAPPEAKQQVAAMLAGWIAASRDAAVARGVDTIPPDVRAVLSGFVDDAILDRVRWRVDATMPLAGLEVLAGPRAMTLDHLVVFHDPDDALTNPSLWAHELIHVRQYRDWGLDGFALRYLEDHRALEQEAAEFRWAWMKATGRTPQPDR
jgi:Domain of unknown function (DUF4157)